VTSRLDPDLEVDAEDFYSSATVRDVPDPRQGELSTRHMLPTFIRCRSSSAAFTIQTINGINGAVCAKLDVAPRILISSAYIHHSLPRAIVATSTGEENTRAGLGIRARAYTA